MHKLTYALSAVALVSLCACGKSGTNAAGDRQSGSADPIYAAAVDAARQLKPECSMIGQAMIQMATPRPGVSDYVRQRQLENTAGHVPEACIRR